MGVSVRWFTLAVTTVLLSTFAVLGIGTAAHAEGEGTILSLVNEARAANNLGPLQLNSSISSVAQAWANQMAANGQMTHNPNYSTQIPSGWSRAGENVAHGYPSPSATHNAWMNSAGHRANILGDYTDIGISFITVDGSTWAVENFAKYGASVPPPAPPAPPPAPAPDPAPPATAPAPARSPPASAPPASPPAASSGGGSAAPRMSDYGAGAQSPSGSPPATADSAQGPTSTSADENSPPPADAARASGNPPGEQQPRLDRVASDQAAAAPGAGSAPGLIVLGLLIGAAALVAGSVAGLRLWRRWGLYFR